MNFAAAVAAAGVVQFDDTSEVVAQLAVAVDGQQKQTVDQLQQTQQYLDEDPHSPLQTPQPCFLACCICCFLPWSHLVNSLYLESGCKELGRAGHRIVQMSFVAHAAGMRQVMNPKQKLLDLLR